MTEPTAAPVYRLYVRGSESIWAAILRRSVVHQSAGVPLDEARRRAVCEVEAVMQSTLDLRHGRERTAVRPVGRPPMKRKAG